MTEIAHDNPSGTNDDIRPTLDHRKLSLEALIRRHIGKAVNAGQLGQQQQAIRHNQIVDKLSRRLAGEPKPERSRRRALTGSCNES